MGDGYGYLWWCPTLGFEARGSGEQYIIVIPLFNVVAVSTNGMNEDEAFSSDAFGHAVKLKSLPPNPDSLNRLLELKKQFTLHGHKEDKILMPDTAKRVSGKTYYFSKQNPLNIKELTFDFGQNKKACLKGITYNDEPFDMIVPVDGSFIKDTTRKRNNDTLFLKGCWQDDKTFTIILEKSQREVMYFKFQGDSVTIHFENRGKSVSGE